MLLHLGQNGWCYFKTSNAKIYLTLIVFIYLFHRNFTSKQNKPFSDDKIYHPNCESDEMIFIFDNNETSEDNFHDRDDRSKRHGNTETLVEVFANVEGFIVNNNRMRNVHID